MAPKQKTRGKQELVKAQVKSSITTRRGKLKEVAEEVKKVNKKQTSIAPPPPKSPIKKFKLNTEKKPQKGVDEVEEDVEGRKSKKIHKCSICGKVFKGVT